MAICASFRRWSTDLYRLHRCGGSRPYFIATPSPQNRVRSSSISHVSLSVRSMASKTVGSAAMEAAVGSSAPSAGGAGAPAPAAPLTEPSRAIARLGGNPTVWEEMTAAVKKYDAVNLGQGFGHPKLVAALAKRYSTAFGREIDANREILVTVGASQALFDAHVGLVNEGDHVLALEPAFDIYLGQAKLVGAAVDLVPMRLRDTAEGKEWFVDFEELEAAVKPETRLLLLNTPHNPTGKVFTEAELRAIGDILMKHPRLILVCDEVYQHLCYEGRSHSHAAALDGGALWDRCLTIGSAGKTFSITGWKIGWIVGPAPLIAHMAALAKYNQFSVATPLQSAVAEALEVADKPYRGFEDYYAWLRAEYSRKRAAVCTALSNAGLRPIAPEGSFFVMADTSGVDVPDEWIGAPSLASHGGTMTRDFAFCHWLASTARVAAIPPSSFCSAEDAKLFENTARFAFCKEDASLEEASRRLAAWAGALSK